MGGVRGNRGKWARREPLYPLVIRLLSLLLRLLFDVRFAGHALPRTGPVLLAANHVDRLDSVAFASVAYAHGRKTRFLALADLWDVRILGWVLRKGRMIPVHRGQGPFRMVEDACHALDAGEAVLIYPEGHLVRDRTDLPAQPGTGLLALTADAPVIPMALWGFGADSSARTTGGHRRFRRSSLGVVTGKPVDLSRWKGRTDQAASQEAADAVLAQIRQLLPAAERLATCSRTSTNG